MSGSAVKIIAIGIVVVVAAAGVATFLVMNNKDDKSNVSVDAALEVYGNADNDYKIDDKDIEVIQKIINKEEGYTLEKYPLADAFKDGNVDETDVNHVQKIINGEDCTVWHMWYKTNTKESRWDSKVVETKWPIKKCIATAGANSLLCYSMLDMDDKIAAINYSPQSPPDKVLYPKYNTMPAVGDSTTKLSASAVTKLVAQDRTITAVITADSKGNLADDKDGCISEDSLEKAGIDVIRVKHASVDPKEFSSALLLLGFLFQKESKAAEVASWIQGVYTKLDEKLAGLETKYRTVASSMTGYVSTVNSDYTDVLVKAGGLSTVEKYTTSSLKIVDNKKFLLEDNPQAQKIVMIRTGGTFGTWYEKDSFDLSKFNTDVMPGFSEFKAYQNKEVYLISGDMPIVARVMYAAVALYPDLVSEDFANDIHQQFVDKFLDSAYDVSDSKFIYNYYEITGTTA